MSSNIDAAFVVQYQSEFSHVFQTQGSKLRSQVWVKNGVAGTSTKFPLLDVAQSTKNRARHSILSGDGDAHSSVTATLDNYESWRFIDSLDEFKTNIDVRRGYSESIVAKLGRDMDNTILTAANTTNTSAGSAAGMDMALVSKVTGLTFKYKWPTGKKTWVITPSVFEKLTAITQFGSRDYNDGQPLKEGAPVRFMGWEFVILPELEDLKVSGTEHKTFAFFERAVGLAVGRDITSKVNYSSAHNADIVLGEMSAGSVAIQQTGILRVNVNGL